MGPSELAGGTMIDYPPQYILLPPETKKKSKASSFDITERRSSGTNSPINKQRQKKEILNTDLQKELGFSQKRLTLMPKDNK